MKYLNNYLQFSKLYRNELKNTKIFVLIIANIWLLLIFWKIVLFTDINIINTNVGLNKASLLLQPILSGLGIDILSPNMLKMMILTYIIIFTNLSIMYFSQMASIIILGMFARYGYKSYTNYLINQENLSYLGFEAKKEVVQSVEPSRIVIENTPVVADAANNTNWGLWFLGALVIITCVGLIVYSHNSLSNSIIETNENIQNVNSSLKNVNNHVNERIVRNGQQIDYINEHTNKMINHMDNKIDLVDQKVTNLEITVQGIGSDLVKANELNNNSVLQLSKQSLSLSHQANNALTEIADASSTAEATTIGLAKIWEIVKSLGERVEVTETRLESLTESTTPRRLGNIVLNTNTLSNIKKSNVNE